MFEFEDDSAKIPRQLKMEDFDIGLGMAISESTVEILSPEEIQKRVDTILTRLLSS